MMNGAKRLKDPVYGYIDIPLDFMTNIVDTANFQRLRRIIQTSYSPLYSSAVHNRFVHSMGVYHLGEIAFMQLKKEFETKGAPPELNLDKVKKVFLLACLLHDVGHAPFSHTGETFYLDSNTGYTTLHETLSLSVSKESFTKDIPKADSKAAAPHEIMSAIIGIKEYADFFIDAEEKEFFARCITGYDYSEITTINSIYNCFISLLNSNVIDVDKLDYLIRDAYITGFGTVNIDYERLLTSLTITKKEGTYTLAYHKNAISVIENVIYAHDSERKWIQSHPTVLYESYLLQHIISHLIAKMDHGDQHLFSLQSLGKTGQTFDNGISIKLLCDDDIVYLMKNLYYNDFCEEFFERQSRRHPIWKSEAEYNAFFLGTVGSGDLVENFEKAMKATALYLSKSSDSWVINEALIAKIQNELEDLNSALLNDKTKAVQKDNKKNILKIVQSLKSYAEKMQIECNFVILMATQFNSGFGKEDFSSIKIVFPREDQCDYVKQVGDIVSSLKARERKRENYFYLFYKRNNSNTMKLDSKSLCTALIKPFLD